MTTAFSASSISISWMPINCHGRNGIILDYVVKFRPVRESLITTGTVEDETFIVSGLNPSTNYSFQVAGINENGTGPFSDLIFIMTEGTFNQ